MPVLNLVRGCTVCRWTEMPRGGHFAATVEPVLLATNIAAFYHAAVS
jgi:hypothetical protein